MIKNILFFENEKDLQDLTGLKHEELWDNGFDLDDMDWGFCSDEEYSHAEIDYYGYSEDHPDYDAPFFAYQLLTWMSGYCVGFRHTEYNGKHYYALYHS